MVDHIWINYKSYRPEELVQCKVCLVRRQVQKLVPNYAWTEHPTGPTTGSDPGCAPEIVHLAHRYLEKKHG